MGRQLTLKLGLFAILSAIVPAFQTAPAGAAGATDWTTYLGSNGRSGYLNTDTLISPSTASSLTTRWSMPAGGSVFSEPIVSAGMVYWGAFDGNEYGTTIFGKTLWTTYLGQTVPPTQCDTPPLGVASTAALAVENISGKNTPVIYVGGGNDQLYALNALNGSILWHIRLGPAGSGFLWDSPVVYHGSVYIGQASVGDCPLVQGKLYKIDAVTGKVTATFKAAPDGCIGDGIWGSPTLDVGNGTIYVTTGNPGECSKPEPYNEAIVELRAIDLSVVGSWRVPQSQRGGDSDFGATPMLFSATPPGKAAISLVGAVNKNGVYYAFRRNQLASGPIWQRYIGGLFGKPKYHSSDIAPSGWDGSTLYIAGRNTMIAGKKCNGGLRALNPLNGTPLWRDCLPHEVLGGVIGANGVIEVGSGDHLIVAAASTGTVLLDTEFTGAMLDGSASISEGTLYAGDMSGNLIALSPAGTF